MILGCRNPAKREEELALHQKNGPGDSEAKMNYLYFLLLWRSPIYVPYFSDFNYSYLSDFQLMRVSRACRVSRRK